MHTLNRELLVSVPESHSVLPELPSVISRAIESVDFTRLGHTDLERLEAQMTFVLWSESLVEMQRFIVSQLPGIPEADTEKFANAFETALADFIKHPDHGMTHSYFVYKGMVHLHKLETGEEPAAQTDIELQLLAVLHDAFQTLPYRVAGENCGIVSKVQKNDHAMIVAKLVKLFGSKFGVSRKKAQELAFALEVHDSSYDNVLHPDRISFTGALLHDSDKLFGASANMDPKNLARGLFHRNAIANLTANNAYVIRAELTPKYRKKITYGDRCYSDGFSLALAEIDFQMYTQSAETISDERKTFALQEMLAVYEEIFDQTHAKLTDVVIPNLNNKSLQLFAAALGNDSHRISDINTETDLAVAINQMYETVLELPKEYHRNSYVTPSDSRGWKLEVLFGTEQFVIDPSIARFCFQKNGKVNFLQVVEQALTEVVL